MSKSKTKEAPKVPRLRVASFYMTDDTMIQFEPGKEQGAWEVTVDLPGRGFNSRVKRSYGKHVRKSPNVTHAIEIWKEVVRC